MGILTKTKSAFRKNCPDLKALLLGDYPRFVYSSDITLPDESTIPVFCFHEVEATTFEQKLIYLQENGYDTIDSDEWLHSIVHGNDKTSKKVILTFDDGDVSLYRTVFPLLKKYQCKAVAFICPGLIPEDQSDPLLDCGRKLCTWSEIREMHESGHVDFQSHSFRHDLVFSSSKLEEFLHPKYKSHYFGKRDHAVVVNDGLGVTLTSLRSYEDQRSEEQWGAPLFPLKPRLAVRQRFVCSGAVTEHICEFVKARSDRDFFLRKDAQKVLRQELSRARSNGLGKYLSAEEHQRHNATELRMAKDAIEEKLPGKVVQHFCAPWFLATRKALDTAFSVGHVSVFLGGNVQTSGHSTANNGRILVQRLSSSYIFRLPGRNRKGLLTSLLNS